jgi:hypothetical protein
VIPALLLLAAAPPPGGALAPVPLLDTVPTASTAPPRVLLAPTWAPPPTGPGPAVTEDQRAGFERHFAPEAGRRLRARGFDLIAPDAADRALTRAGSGGPCRDSACLSRAARDADARYWLAVLLVAEPGHCAARAVLYSVDAQAVLRRRDDFAAPCTAEHLLGLAADLARQVAEGPNVPHVANLALTPRGLPELGIPDLPDVDVTLVATSTRPRTLDYASALALYRRHHLVLFDVPERDRYLLAQDGRLITECEAWQAAWQAHHAALDQPNLAQGPLPKELEAYCRGNAWEWAWAGVPLGALVAWGSWGKLTEGQLSGVTGFLVALVTAGVSAGLALSLDEDAKAPEDGDYLGARAELEAMVRAANAALRRRLELSDQDVWLGGMRR